LDFFSAWFSYAEGFSYVKGSAWFSYAEGSSTALLNLVHFCSAWFNHKHYRFES